jgi:hypothetical protein
MVATDVALELHTPPLTVLLKVVVAPAQMFASPLIVPASALPPTLAMVVYTADELQPVVVLLTVSEKVVVPAMVVIGFCWVEVNPLDPVHDHRFALLECAFSVTDPAHVPPLLVAPVDDGSAFTVSAAVERVVPPQPGAVADSVYTPASVGVAVLIVALAVVLLLIVLVPPFHSKVYPLPPVTVAFRWTVLPTQTGLGLTDADIDDGIWLTVTAFVVALALQPLAVTVTL